MAGIQVQLNPKLEVYGSVWHSDALNVTSASEKITWPVPPGSLLGFLNVVMKLTPLEQRISVRQPGTLWESNIATERSTMFNGKTHYKRLCSIVILVYQRVNLRKSCQLLTCVRHAGGIPKHQKSTHHLDIWDWVPTGFTIEQFAVLGGSSHKS